MSKSIDALRGPLAANPCGRLIDEPVEYSEIDSADPPRRACHYEVAAREESAWQLLASRAAVCGSPPAAAAIDPLQSVGMDEMPDKTSIAIEPLEGPIHATVRPPGSKSITNRALIVAALADGSSRLTGALDSDDTRVMIESLRRLGLRLTLDPAAQAIEIAGCAGQLAADSAELWLENSGTSMRFLTAAACLGRGVRRLDGNARMRQRPIGPLCDALRSLGCDARCEGAGGCPPVVVHANGMPGGRAAIAADLSSQFLSALLMSAPCANAAVELALRGSVVSEPYVAMTLRVMAEFGVEVEALRAAGYRVRSQTYRGRAFAIEPDASAASYFFAAAAITGGEVTVEGLSHESLQGDVRFVEVLEQMGCDVCWGSASITVQGGPLHGVDVDMNDISDTAQTLAAVAVFADGPTRIRNIAHVRLKETDRIRAVVTELDRLGIEVQEHEDGLTIRPPSDCPSRIRPALVQTYDDHRMAMSFALIGLRAPGIRISDPACVGKTYPEFFNDLAAACRGTRGTP
jgi:3-phosphoshikimate 1-carboxyvinyltransferase